MNVIKQKILSKNTIALWGLLITGMMSFCSSIPPLSEDNAIDFSKTGFLDQHHFQVVIKAQPAKNTQGLVERRDSANIRARNKLQETCIKALEEYIYRQNPDITRPNPKLRDKILPYLTYGTIYTEFYTKQHQAILIYRIQKKNLLHSLNNIHLEFK